MLGEDLSFREKVVAMSTMLSLIDLNVITPPSVLIKNQDISNMIRETQRDLHEIEIREIPK